MSAFGVKQTLKIYGVLHLKPWQTNPLDAVDECPYPPGTAGALSWPLALALREELEKASQRWHYCWSPGRSAWSA
jgi:hypothetical protein